MSTKTNKMQGVGPSHETPKTSAGLQPARLVSSGNRAFTRRKATASIGLKPMRLAVHHTRQKILYNLTLVSEIKVAPQQTAT